MKKLKIIVGEGSCGIAAGAGKVYDELQALLQRQPVVAEWTGQGRCLRFAVSLGGLSLEDRRDAALCLHDVCYEWKKATFEEVKEE